MNDSLFSFGPEVYTKRRSTEGCVGWREGGGEGSNLSPCPAARVAEKKTTQKNRLKLENWIPDVESAERGGTRQIDNIIQKKIQCGRYFDYE
jgi:hypothetical protein